MYNHLKLRIHVFSSPKNELFISTEEAGALYVAPPGFSDQTNKIQAPKKVFWWLL